MIKEINEELLKSGFETQLDDEGVYIPEYNVDVIYEESKFIINPSNSDPMVFNSLSEAIHFIKDFSYSMELEKEMNKNNYIYKKENPRFFSMENNRVKIIDGRFYLIDDSGETSVFVNISSIIGAIQSKLLGEK
ncbi:TPA: hypothetical protein I1T43_002335 [Staphylococcus aureus]|nr:hypothetical protein [Staphylococcus aureus]